MSQIRGIRTRQKRGEVPNFERCRARRCTMRVADKSNFPQRMTSNRFKTSLLLAALTFAGAASSAEERAVMIGHTELYVPIAAGYTDTKVMPDGEKEEATIRLEPGAQLVSMQIRHGDRDSYILIKTPAAMADQRLSLDDFLKITSQTKASKATLANFASFGNAAVKGREHELDEALGQKVDRLRVGQLALLHRGREDDDAAGYTAVWRADIDAGGEHVAAKFLLCTYVARVKEKLLFIQLHAPQLNAGDYRWVTEVCDRYVDDIVATNKVERIKRMVPSRPAPVPLSSSEAAVR